MEFITGVYLVYSFIAFYFLFLFILIYIQNKQYFFYSPPITKEYSLSLVIPCFNEGKDIEKVVDSILANNYRNLKKIIIVDDCSTDNSFEIAKKVAEKHQNVIAVQTPKNTGCAAGSKNYGAKFVKTELIGFSDGDSFPEPDSIHRMIGFFDDEKVGAVTSNVLVKNRDNVILKLQSIEYKVIKFSRKLLEFVDAIYVTPGPLAVYRKSAFDKIGGFDEKNLTEDIEITWHLQHEGYKIKMSTLSKVYTIAPTKVKAWIKQRNRWNIGGLQTIGKYKKALLRKGMLGNFILPFFVFSWVIGIFGLGLLGYRIFSKFALSYLSATYSVKAHTAILNLQGINLTPNLLVFFGLAVFFLGLFFTFIALASVKEKGFKRENPLTVGFYMLFYLMAYPIILINSGYKYLRGDRKW